MNEEIVIDVLNKYLVEGLKLKRIIDDNVKHLYGNSYYCDENQIKYLICFNIFNNIKEMQNKWEEYQDEDIASYLQSKKFYNSDIKWDIYYILIFTGGGELPLESWFHIEKDKFCCKKVFIHATNKKDMEYQIQQKLPIVKNYYPNTRPIIIDDTYFFEKVCDELNISKDVISFNKNGNEIISDIYKRLGGDDN